MRAWRAMTAVVALYALVLQSVLGSAAVTPAASPFDVICLKLLDGGAKQPAQPLDHADRHACCTGAVFAATVEPPLADAHLIGWPLRLATRLAWRWNAVAAARPPPSTVASARAPPVV